MEDLSALALQKVIALSKDENVSQCEKIDAFESLVASGAPPSLGRIEYVKFLISQGLHGRALKQLSQLTDSGFGDFETYFYGGVCYNALGKEKNALGCWLKALEFNPDNAVCLSNAGSVYLKASKWEKAEDVFLKAHQIAPKFAPPIEGLVKLYTESRKLDQAIEFQMKLIRLKEEPGKFVGLTNLLMKNGEFDKARKILHTVQKVHPDDPVVANALGGIYYKFAQLDEALFWFRKATELAPGYAAAVANYLLCLNYAQLSPDEVMAEHLKFGAALGSQQAVVQGVTPAQKGRVVMGFVSPDFFQHPVGQLIEPVLQHLNNGRFPVYLYYTASVKDDLTQRLQNAFGKRFVMCEGWTDELLQRRIASDEVNVLFDLSGHTSGHRLSLFAKRAAPVQVTYLGYPNTTGVQAMDFRLVDHHTDPAPGADLLSSERLVRIAPPFLNMTEPRVRVPVNPLPSLNQSGFVLGCFNNLAKITDLVLQTWGKVLSRIEGSTLLLKAASLEDAEIRRFQIERMKKCGVPVDRVTMHARMGYSDHLKLYNQIDLCLDPFPYNGAATTNEALWMGVPVVVLEGASHAGRVGTSFNRSLGLNQFVARDLEEYVELCHYWSVHKDELNQIRLGMRDRISTSSAADAKRSAEKIEQAVVEMLTASMK